MRIVRSAWERRRAILYAAGAAVFMSYAGAMIGPPGADASPFTVSHLHRTMSAFDSVGLLDVRGRAAAQTYIHNGTGVVVGMHMMSDSDAGDLAASLGLTPDTVPAMEIGTAVSKPAVRPSAKVTTLNLGDSGAGLHAINGMRYAVPGTITANTTPIATANGVIVPPHKCQARIPMRMNDGSVKNLRLDDAVILSDSAHNLISLGLLAREQHVATYIGPGESASMLIFPDGSQAPLANVGVLVLPDSMSDFTPAMTLAGDDASPVVGGEGRTNVSWKTLHATFANRPWRLLRTLPMVLRDAPAAWSKVLAKDPQDACDDCLRARASNVSSDNHMPEVVAPGELVSVDIYETGVGHIHGGHKYVVGFHDFYSGLTRVYLLKRKSDAPVAYKMYYAWCSSHRVYVKRFNTDNAGELSGEPVRAWARDLRHPCRVTTSSPRSSRQNGAIERQWRIIGDDMRANMAHAQRLPDTYWWYALRDGVMKSWVIPVERGADKSPWELFTGNKPSGRYLKPFGCLCYYKVYEPRTKVMMRARRAVLLGRPDDQPGYLVKCLETDVIKVTPHVRFCVDQRPGLSKTPREGEPAPEVVWPQFNRSVDHVESDVSPDARRLAAARRWYARRWGGDRDYPRAPS